VLIDPKFPHNVGAAVRAASRYGVGQVWFAGERVQLVGERRFRLPREERMRGYQDVELRHSDQPFDAFNAAEPVAVELRRNAEPLITFEHPDHAVYVLAQRTARWTVRCSDCATGPWRSRPGTAPTWPPPSTPCSHGEEMRCSP
jgi:hypothetical protein